MSRPRGFIESWRPQKRTQAQLDAVNDILLEYQENLPLTIRQIYYRLIGKGALDKTEKQYKALCEMLGIARRAGRIPMDAIRDDGFTGGYNVYDGHWSVKEFWKNQSRSARAFKFDRQKEQSKIIVVLCEAGGMVPQLERVAEPYSVTVKSSGGFDSITVKHQIGQQWGQYRPVTILHIGDYDPSGECMFDALQEDCTAFAEHYGNTLDFVRIAVTPRQIIDYDLETAPPKDSSHQSKKRMTQTTQAEALDPATLANILRSEIESRLNMDNFRLIGETETDARAGIIQQMQACGVYFE